MAARDALRRLFKLDEPMPFGDEELARAVGADPDEWKAQPNPSLDEWTPEKARNLVRLE